MPSFSGLTLPVQNSLPVRQYLLTSVSVFGFRSSDFGPRTSVFGLRTSLLGLRSSVFGLRTSVSLTILSPKLVYGVKFDLNLPDHFYCAESQRIFTSNLTK